jgi:DNA-binding transcriptional ArsR family regulator
MEDQIDYMNNVLRLDKVLFRIEDFVEMTTSEYLKSKLPHQTVHPLPSYTKQVLKELFIKGELKRSEVVELTNKSQRSVDYLMKQLKEMNLVTKLSKHSPFEVNIPYYYAEIIFPGIGKY